jgi:hypothetical protein
VQAEAVNRLRASPHLGNVVLRRASPEVKALVDVWPRVPHAGVIQAVKRAMDPSGTLGGGRGV